MANEIKPTCVLMGPVSTLSGYGGHARDVFKALLDWGEFDIKIISTRWGSTPMTALDNDDPLSVEIKKRIHTGPLNTRPELFVQVSIPNEAQPIGVFNVMVTAGIETTTPRAEWIEGLNRMHMAIVPSNFAKEVLEKASFVKRHPDGREEAVKLQRPIDVVFEPADTEIFKKTNEPSADIDAALNAIPEDFNYLFVGHWLQGDVGADRKDVGMLVKVFCQTFKGQPNKPGLILKTSGAGFSMMDRDEILKKINIIRTQVGGNDLPNVYLVHGELTPVEINRLYNHPKVKAHVSFTHGEGWGRPMLEATLSGKPLLASGWSGHLDFLPADVSNLLPGEVKQIHPSAANEWVIKESGWFVVNYSVAAQKLEDMFKHYETYLPNAEKLRKKNAEKFTINNATKLFIDTLKKRLPVFEKKVIPTLPKFKKIGPTI